MRSICIVEVDVPDFANSSPEVEVTYRFAKPTDYLPSEFNCIPSIAGISFTPSTISLGQNLGERATLTITFQDHRHIMNGESFTSGTFWGKWRARYGTRLRGRSVRWITGLEGQALEEMETRHFIIESTDGPDTAGMYRIVAKDVLKLADNDRAQAPVLSNGFLLNSINDSTTSATLSPAGIGNSEYPASGYVAIGGEEICAFSRSGNALTLTRGQFGTVAVAHEDQDRVQLCLQYNGEDPADIIADLLENYAGIDPAYIPLSSWQTETGTYLQRVYSTLIAEPTGVNTLVSEIIEQAALAMWWDDLSQLIRLQVLREVPTTAALFDEDNTLEGSLKNKEQPNKRVSQVWTYFGLRNPCEPIEDPDNYRSTAITADLEAETDYGGAVIKKVFSRWIPAGGRTVATRLNELILSRFKDAPRQFGFELFRYGQQTPSLGGGYRLASWVIQTETGEATDAPIQITRLNPTEDRFVVEAEEMLFDGSNQGDITDRVIIIDSNSDNINLRTMHDSLYPVPTGSESPAITVTFIVDEGVLVGSTSVNTYCVTVGTWPTGVEPILQVIGNIRAPGGQGGGTADHGQRGGSCIHTREPITIDMQGGTIWAGGGGGGGGGYNLLGRGGGGAGTPPGAGGHDSFFSPDGSPGTATSGGASAGSGAGSGGGRGQAGGNGTEQSGGGPDDVDGGDGGAAGTAIDGVSFVTYSSGTTGIVGPQIN